MPQSPPHAITGLLFFSPNAAGTTRIEEQLLGIPRPLTQIGRILSELGVQHIRAHSPQAKGRIERAFGTLQQRLVLELRLAGASNLEQANAVLQRFIPRYNAQFAVPPAEAEDAFRPVPSHIQLDHVFCWKEPRTLNPGYVIHYNGHIYRLRMPPGVPAIPLRAIVQVHKHLDGQISVAYNGRIYPAEIFHDRPTEPETATATAARHQPPKRKAGSTHPRRPAANHPWRARAVIPKA